MRFFSRQWGDRGKPTGIALRQATELTGYGEANIRYRVVTGIDEMDSVTGLTTLLANLLAVVAGRSLRSPNHCNSGTLAVEG